MPKHAAPTPQLPRRRELRESLQITTIEHDSPATPTGLSTEHEPSFASPQVTRTSSQIAAESTDSERIAAPVDESRPASHPPRTEAAPVTGFPPVSHNSGADEHIELVPPLPLSPTSTGAASTPRRWGARRILATTSAFAGASALLLTMALPGIEPLTRGTGHVSALDGQGLDADDVGDFTATFDALNSVIIEAGDGLDTFVNFRDAAVQYPFADAVPLSDPFGERSWPVAGLHDAQDFAAAEGTQVQAIADGKVLEAGFASDGCGFGLKLEHEIDDLLVTSRYCHMQANSHELQVGDTVRVGDPVGNVGNTGLSFGAHLHFALTVDGEAVDPMPFLDKYNRLTRAR